MGSSRVRVIERVRGITGSGDGEDEIEMISIEGGGKVFYGFAVRRRCMVEGG